MEKAGPPPAFGEAPPPYSLHPPVTEAPPVNVPILPNYGAPMADVQVTYEPKKMTKSKVKNMHNDRVTIDGLNLTDQFIEISNNHNGIYSVDHLLLRNSKLEASNMHNTHVNIRSLRMECGNLEAKNIHNATVTVDSLDIVNGVIEMGNMHNSTISIGTLQLGTLTIKGKNIHNTDLKIDSLLFSSNHQSSSMKLRPIQNVTVSLRNLDLSNGVDASRFLELLMMRATYA